MDTKTLLDAALEAGINLLDEDSISDLEEVWLEACLSNYEWVEEWLPDFLSDLDALDLHKIASESYKAYDDTQWLQDYSKGNNHLGLSLAYCNSAAMRTTGVGAVIVKKIIAGAKTVVAKHLYDWFAECQGYLIDMNQCHEEDAAQRRREDYASV